VGSITLVVTAAIVSSSSSSLSLSLGCFIRGICQTQLSPNNSFIPQNLCHNEKTQLTCPRAQQGYAGHSELPLLPPSSRLNAYPTNKFTAMNSECNYNLTSSGTISLSFTSCDLETDADRWYSTNSFKLLNLTTQTKNFPCASRSTLKCCTPSEHLERREDSSCAMQETTNDEFKLKKFQWLFTSSPTGYILVSRHTETIAGAKMGMNCRVGTGHLLSSWFEQ
jgi:hypothetical protein